MQNGIKMTVLVSHWLTLLTAFVISIPLSSGMSATAARVIGSARLSRSAQADDLAEAKRLNNEAFRLYGDRRYKEAMPLAERALALWKRALGPDDPGLATPLDTLARIHIGIGDYAKAEPLYKLLLAIWEKKFGPHHGFVATPLDKLAALYTVTGNYTKAEPLYQRALAINEKALGSGHWLVAQSLDNLAAVYDAKAEYAKAEPLYQRALAIRKKVLSPNDPDQAQSLNNLAGLYTKNGDYVKAEPLYQQALAIVTKSYGPEHPAVAISLNGLGDLYRAKGDLLKAWPLLQRALAIRVKTRDPNVAITLNSLEKFYQAKNAFNVSDPERLVQFQQILAFVEKVMGTDHPAVADSLNALAELYYYRSEYAEAEPLLQRALAIREKAYGPESSGAATGLKDIARLYYFKGEYAKAQPLYERALAIDEIALGPQHPDVAVLLDSLATLYESEGDTLKAVDLRIRATNISEHNIALNLIYSSERQKLLYLTTFSGETNYVLSLHTQSAPHNSSALRLALTTVLRRKGRALDAMAESIATLRSHLNPELQALLDQLSGTRARLASLALNGSTKRTLQQYREETRALENQIETLENAAGRQSAEYLAQSQSITLNGVQALIPPDVQLIEFVSFRPFDLNKIHLAMKRGAFEFLKKQGIPDMGLHQAPGQARYVAYVLGNQGEPQWVDLGKAEEIDKAVNELRGLLHKDKGTPLSDIEGEVKSKARLLDQKIMQPVRKLLGDKHKLLISPDGVLNLIPFAALVDERDQYLVENYSISYLTSGRDLLRLQAKTQNKQGAMVVADPDFGGDMTPCLDRKLKISGGSVDFSQVLFCPLSATSDEAEAIQALMPDATVLTRQQATETSVKHATAPKILHIATHGFFLEDVVINPAAASRGVLIANSKPGAAMKVENPLLRSGLALAGANLHKSGNDDGILTALEVSGLDLLGTKLVVLSACDTGVGEVKNGDGVYGLRRALVLAGSESQVMSLWSVNDEATRDLMIDYYTRLQAGEGRAEALRQVQLKMLASTDRQHPYYWAGFIESGEWANLDGKR